MALRADLQTLRAMSEFFRATHGRYPVTLKERLVEPIGSVAGQSLVIAGPGPTTRANNEWTRSVIRTTIDAVQGVVRIGTHGYETWEGFAPTHREGGGW